VARVKSQKALAIEVKRGRPSTGLAPPKEDLLRLYVRERKSIREIAQELDLSKDMIARGLKRYGIKTREKSKTKESVLSKYPLSYLEDKITKEGYREAAKYLGVGNSTLYFYVKRRKRDS
jgi:transposase